MRTPAGMNAPDDVVDVLLWRLAHDVAANHQPHPHDPARCTNLRCTAEVYPCSAARDAARALRACGANNRPTPTVGEQARVRAAAPAPGQIWGWFGPTRTTITRPTRPPVPSWPLPRRRPLAALRSA